MSNLNRREFMRAGALTTAVLAASPWVGVAQGMAETALRVLKASSGSAPLLGPKKNRTPIWGYDGMAPGPVLRVRQSSPLAVRLANQLPQATSIHWHGVRLPNAMDGVSGVTQEAVPKGATFDYRFSPPDAGTFWYHSHNRSWEQMARGLHGMLIVEETEPPGVDHDIPFIFDDWRLDDKNGEIHAASFGDIRDWAHGGRLGNWITVNGVSQPEFPVKAGDRIRLRVLNAANARIVELSFPDHQPTVIALDGQPVTPYPLGAKPLVIAPGQRVDLIIDMAMKPGATVPVEFIARNQKLTIARFAYDSGPARRNNPLDSTIRLPVNPLPTSLDLASTKRVELRMEGGAMGRMTGAMMQGRMMGMRELVAAGKVWAFNGTAGPPEKPLVRVNKGQTVIVDMINANSWAHAMHLHGHHFRVVERQLQTVSDSPWRDTELVLPNERVAVAFVAAEPGKWLLHCHMLEHQAGGMMTWIEVV